MPFEVGEKAVYPAHGVGVIKEIEKTLMDDTEYEFYVLKILDNGMTIRVPTNNADAIGMREIIPKSAVEKVYEAIAPLGAGPWPRTARHRLAEPPGENFMQMQVVAGEPNAETWIDLVEPLHGPHEGLARYELRPRTGLRHQLRVQMNALGLPLLGDRIYPVLQPHENPPSFEAPLQLVARALSFTDPITGQARHFERAALTIAHR